MATQRHAPTQMGLSQPAMQSAAAPLPTHRSSRAPAQMHTLSPRTMEAALSSASLLLTSTSPSAPQGTAAATICPAMLLEVFNTNDVCMQFCPGHDKLDVILASNDLLICNTCTAGRLAYTQESCSKMLQR